MSKLDVKQDKKVVSLRKKGLSYREIAKLMGKRVSTVYARHKRAVQNYS